MRHLQSKIVTPFFLLLLLTCILSYTIIAKPYNNSPPIRSDGVGYHIWTYGFKSFDFSFCQYKEILDPTGSISYVNENKNICAIKYPPGVALAQLPLSIFFLSQHPENGFSAGDHLSVLVTGSILLILITIFSFQSLRLLGCDPNRALLAIISFVFGSGLFHYATYDASFSHIYSALGVSMIAWMIIKHSKNGWTFNQLGWLMMMVFWFYLVRQTNGIISLGLLCLAYRITKSQIERYQIFIAWSIGIVAGILTQLAYNYYVFQELRLSSYGEEGFLTLGKHSLKVLLSYERGLFTYYPIFFLTIILAVMVWKRAITWLFIALILGYAFLYGSWHSWSLGSGFGHRGFVEIAPIGILVLGMALQQLKGLKLMLSIFFTICSIYIALSVMLSYWNGSYPIAGAEKKNYLTTLLPSKF